MQPRYQVFLSSTFRDLREERQAVLEAILELGHFPAGMEAFPAADSTPWELIQSIIADSDYYVLVIGGKYGSTGPDGISYTEMEFDLAVSMGKPILAFLHGDPEKIPVGKSELEPDARQRLQAFRSRVGERLCKGWTSKDDLKSAVLLGLVHLIRTKPAFGWVRNEGLQNQELLQRLATLQARFDQLEAEAKHLRERADDLYLSDSFQSLESIFGVRFKISSVEGLHSVGLSWVDIFYGIADEMLVACPERSVAQALDYVIAGALTSDQVSQIKGRHSVGDEKSSDRLASYISVDDKSMSAILLQLMAKGLVEPEMILRQAGDQSRRYTTTQRCWKLTQSGRGKYLEKRAFR